MTPRVFYCGWCHKPILVDEPIVHLDGHIFHNPSCREAYSRYCETSRHQASSLGIMGWLEAQLGGKP